VSVDEVAQHQTSTKTLHDRAPRGTELLRIEGLRKYFPIKAGLIKREVGQIKAVDGVDLTLKAGETLGVVGESGCGKSTMARSVARLLDPTDGKVTFRGYDITYLSRRELREFRREIQFVFQDPYASLNPRMTVREIIAEPLRVHGRYRSGGKEQVNDLMETVGLKSEHGNRFPHEFRPSMFPSKPR
jgi:ABC-type microcin C transport system duplicated ATPase subunit YejF